MQLIPVLVCVTVLSVAETLSFPIYYPKLKLVASHNKPAYHEKFIIKLPSERRLAIFPKMNKKFYMTTEPQHVVFRPIRRPVMKKLAIRNRYYDYENNVIEPLTKRPDINTNLFDKYDLEIPQEKVYQEKTKEAVVKTSAESSEETKDGDDDNGKEIQATIEPTIEEHIKTEEPILKPVEIKTESLNEKQILTADKVKLNDDDNQIADKNEFIFVNPAKQAKKESDEDETIEEYATTEAKEKAPRVKRYNNIIEEENLRTTVAGYKYTWRDARLTNNLAFNNINS